MKIFATAFLAAVFGIMVSRWVIPGVVPVRADAPGKVEAREFVLLDEHNQVAARLASANGRTMLTFFGNNGNKGIEVGMGGDKPERFIHFFGRNGEVIAALNSVTPIGQTTLYMGDERWGSRVIFGSLPTDVASTSVNINDDWGLEFRKPGSSHPLMNILIKPDNAHQSYIAALRLIRSNGSIWGVH